MTRVHNSRISKGSGNITGGQIRRAITTKRRTVTIDEEKLLNKIVNAACSVPDNAKPTQEQIRRWNYWNKYIFKEKRPTDEKFSRKDEINPSNSADIRSNLYQSFHGAQPIKKTKVYYESPDGEPLIKIGRLACIEYIPEPPSKHTGVRYTHESGDLGHKIINSNAILATNAKGTQLYIVREKKKVKYPKFDSRGRGIIG